MVLDERNRRIWKWSPMQESRAASVLDVVAELKQWWPLTVRQIYYRLLARRFFLQDCWLIKGERLKDPYGALCTLAKWMRIDGKLPWNVITDETRKVSDKRGFEDLPSFIEQEMHFFLRDYDRCLIQGQDNYVEVWTEKNALSKIFEDVARPYCIRVVTCRGYQSVSFIADYYNRAAEAFQKGQRPVVLYFGDLDPSGWDMFRATAYTLENEMCLSGVEYRRVALVPEQIEEYDLPTDPTAAKKTDKRYKRYHEIYGDLAVEIDALHPADLSEIAKQSIEECLDMSFFAEQKEVEQVERSKVEELRKDVEGYIYQRIANF